MDHHLKSKKKWDHLKESSRWVGYISSNSTICVFTEKVPFHSQSKAKNVDHLPKWKLSIDECELMQPEV